MEAPATEAPVTEAFDTEASARKALAWIQALRQLWRTWQSTVGEYSKRTLVSTKGEQARIRSAKLLLVE